MSSVSLIMSSNDGVGPTVLMTALKLPVVALLMSSMDFSLLVEQTFKMRFYTIPCTSSILLENTKLWL